MRTTAATIVVGVVVAVATLGAVPRAASATSVFDRNLIVNPGAEAGVGSADGYDVVPIPGWTVTGNATVGTYQQPDPQPNDDLPKVGGPGPADRGARLFAGGPCLADRSVELAIDPVPPANWCPPTTSTISQVIDVSPAAALIDARAVMYALSGFLGGFYAHADHASVTASFRRGATELGAAAIGPVTVADRAGALGLFHRAVVGRVPAGTRTIVVTVSMTKEPSFRYNDGYADSLRLVLSSVLGSNLIVNGDAEVGDGVTAVSQQVSVPGWRTDGSFTAARYGTEGFPGLADPGPAARGNNLFVGGPCEDLVPPDCSDRTARAVQTVSIRAVAGLVDQGALRFRLSGFLGGYLGQEDSAVVRIVFLSSTGRALGSASIGPVTAAQRGNVTGLLERIVRGRVPVGTRSIRVTLTMTKQAGVGAYNDGFADNLRLVLIRS